MLQPTEAPAGSVEFRSIDYPTYRFAILVAVFGIAGLVWLVLKRTNVGLVVRLRRAGYEAVGTISGIGRDWTHCGPGGPSSPAGFNGSTTTSRCAIRGW